MFTMCRLFKRRSNFIFQNKNLSSVRTGFRTLQRVRFWNKSFKMCPTLDQVAQSVSDLESKASQPVRFRIRNFTTNQFINQINSNVSTFESMTAQHLGFSIKKITTNLIWEQKLYNDVRFCIKILRTCPMWIQKYTNYKSKCLNCVTIWIEAIILGFEPNFNIVSEVDSKFSQGVRFGIKICKTCLTTDQDAQNLSDFESKEKYHTVSVLNLKKFQNVSYFRREISQRFWLFNQTVRNLSHLESKFFKVWDFESKSFNVSDFESKCLHLQRFKFQIKVCKMGRFLNWSNCNV